MAMGCTRRGVKVEVGWTCKATACDGRADDMRGFKDVKYIGHSEEEKELLKRIKLFIFSFSNFVVVFAVRVPPCLPRVE